MRTSPVPLKVAQTSAGFRRMADPRRGFWVLVLGLHLLAVPSVVEHVTSADATGDLAMPWVRAAWLSASLGFFLLKIADVPSLRFRRGRRSVLSATLAIVLFHAVVVERSDERVMDAVPRVGLVVAVGSFPYWLNAARRAVRRFVRNLRALLLSPRKIVDAPRRGVCLVTAPMNAPVQVVLRSSRALRAPPHGA